MRWTESDLTPRSKQLSHGISQHAWRIQKVLQDEKLQLGSVLSDVPGESGRVVLRAFIGRLAEAADPRLEGERIGLELMHDLRALALARAHRMAPPKEPVLAAVIGGFCG